MARLGGRRLPVGRPDDWAAFVFGPIRKAQIIGLHIAEAGLQQSQRGKRRPASTVAMGHHRVAGMKPRAEENIAQFGGGTEAAIRGDEPRMGNVNRARQVAGARIVPGVLPREFGGRACVQNALRPAEPAQNFRTIRKTGLPRPRLGRERCIRGRGRVAALARQACQMRPAAIHDAGGRAEMLKDDQTRAASVSRPSS